MLFLQTHGVMHVVPAEGRVSLQTKNNHQDVQPPTNVMKTPSLI